MFPFKVFFLFLTLSLNPCTGCPFTLLRTALLQSQVRAKINTGRGDTWISDGQHGAELIQRNFSTLLGDQSLRDFVVAERAKHGRCHVLELFGSAVFVPAEDVDSLTGARLTTQQFNFYGDPKHAIVTGNLHERSPWRRLKERFPDGADVIVIHPVAGFWISWDEGEGEHHLLAGAILLERAYQLLNRDHGVLLVKAEIDDRFDQSEIAGWLFGLKAAGIQVTFLLGSEDITLRIRRKPGSPDSLLR